MGGSEIAATYPGAYGSLKNGMRTRLSFAIPVGVSSPAARCGSMRYGRTARSLSLPLMMHGHRSRRRTNNPVIKRNCRERERTSNLHHRKGWR